jgi:hypothetical protein
MRSAGFVHRSFAPLFCRLFFPPLPVAPALGEPATRSQPARHGFQPQKGALFRGITRAIACVQAIRPICLICPIRPSGHSLVSRSANERQTPSNPVKPVVFIPARANLPPIVNPYRYLPTTSSKSSLPHRSAKRGDGSYPVTPNHRTMTAISRPASNPLSPGRTSESPYSQFAAIPMPNQGYSGLFKPSRVIFMSPTTPPKPIFAPSKFSISRRRTSPIFPIPYSIPLDTPNATTYTHPHAHAESPTTPFLAFHPLPPVPQPDARFEPPACGCPRPIDSTQPKIPAGRGHLSPCQWTRWPRFRRSRTW